MINSLYNNIYALFKGFLTVFKHVAKKPVTLEYPEVKNDVSHEFRGKHEFNINNCKGCGICIKVCPANAITIINNNSTVEQYIIDYNKCIFCGNCAEFCKFSAIKMGNAYELATNNKDLLVNNFTKVEDINE